MKRKGIRLAGIFILSAALALGTGTANIYAAEDTQSAPPKEDAATKDQEPEVPESYEWEIQSNKISGWPQGPKVIAETAILMDADTGQILYAKGIDEKRAPASTTKIMTAMLAIEKVPMDTQITFTNEVNNIEPDSTHIGIKPGETLTMKDSIYGILLASANEVSSGVAEYIGGTVPKFVDMMNQRAKDLGCENTHFVNANGLYSEDHYTTARDLATIARAAFQNETFRDIIKTPYYIVPTTNITNEERWLNNHHKMLPGSEKAYEGCLGGKTGYTEKAGNTLVTYAQRNDMTLICVVLAGTVDYYSDTAAILDYGFNNFHKLDSSESLKADKKNALGTALDKAGVLNDAVVSSSLDVPSKPSEEITYKANVNSDLLNLDFYYGDTLLAQSSQQASPEVLAIASDFNKETTETSSVSTENLRTNQSPDEASENNLKENFKELSAWKYPALIFLSAALIFYMVLLIVKIRRKRRKKKFQRKKGNDS